MNRKTSATTTAAPKTVPRFAVLFLLLLGGVFNQAFACNLTASATAAGSTPQWGWTFTFSDADTGAGGPPIDGNPPVATPSTCNFTGGEIDINIGSNSQLGFTYVSTATITTSGYPAGNGPTVGPCAFSAGHLICQVNGTGTNLNDPTGANDQGWGPIVVNVSAAYTQVDANTGLYLCAATVPGSITAISGTGAEASNLTATTDAQATSAGSCATSTGGGGGGGGPSTGVDVYATPSAIQTVVVGTPVTVITSCSNNGTDPAVNARCAVTGAPAGATTTCTPTGGTVASLVTNAVITCTTKFTPIATGTVTLTTTASTDSRDTNFANNTATSTVIVNAPAVTPPALTIRKDGPASVLANGAIQYTVRLGNTSVTTSGTSPVVVDALPTGSTFVSAAPSAGVSSVSCSGTSTLSCTLALPTGIATGGTASFLINTTAPATAGTIANYAATNPKGDGTPPGNPPTTAGCTASATTVCSDTSTNPGTIGTPTVITPPAALTIRKDGPATVLVGGAVQYTVTLGNTSVTTSDTSLIVMDALPAGSSFVSAAPGAGVTSVTCSGTTTLTCTLALPTGIATGGAAAFVINTTAPTTAGTIVNYAGTNPNGDGTAPGNPPTTAGCTASATTACSDSSTNPGNPGTTTIVTPPAALSIRKTGAATVAESGDLLYTLTLTNSSVTSSATTLVVEDALPAGSTYVSSAPGAGVSSVSCSGSAPIVCTLTLSAGIAQNGTASFTIDTTAPSSPGLITNYSATNPNGDGNPPGTPPTTGGCVASATTACSDSPANPGNPGTPTTVLTPAAVTISKALTSGASPISPSETLVYTITLTNSGGTDATAYALSDALPANTVFVSASNGGALNGSTINWTNLTVPATSATSVTVTVQVAATLPAGTAQIANVAYVTGGTPPACPSSDPACVSTPTVGNIAISKALTSGTTPVTAGESLTYTITLSNTGGSDVSNFALSDNLPANTTFASATGGGVLNGSTVNWTGLTIAAGSSASVTVTVTVANPIPTGAVSIDNIAYATGSTPPACPSSDPACVSTPTAGNVVISKSLTTGATPISAGEVLTYTITLNNAGGSAVSAFGVSDNLPTYTTFVSASNGGTLSGSTVNWTGLSIGEGASTTLTVTVQVANPIPTSVTSIANIAYQTGNVPPACPGASPACVVTPTAGYVTISKALTAGASPIVAGESLTYTITLTNPTAQDVTGYVLADNVPSNTTFVSASGNGALSGTTVNWTNLTVPANSTITETIVLSVVSPIPSGVTYIANVAYQGGTVPPACPSADPACVSTPITGGTPAALTLRKDGPASVLVNGDVLYTLTLGNTSATASNTTLIVQDALPSGSTFVSASPGAGVSAVTCTGAPALSCSLTLTTPLVQGSTASFTIDTTAPAVAGSITNYAATNPNGDGTAPGNPPTNTGCTPSATTVCSDTSVTPGTPGTPTTVTDPPLIAAALTLRKDGPAQVTDGGAVQYVLTLSNTSTTPSSTTLVVVDALPTGSTFVSATAASGVSAVSCTGSATVTCTLTLNAAIAQGGSVSFNLATLAPNVAGAITNYAATNPNGDGTPPGTTPNQSGCTTSPTTVCSDTTANPGTPGTPTIVVDPPLVSAALTIRKDGAATVKSGGDLLYTLSLGNTSSTPSAATLIVTDALPTGSTFVSAAAGAGVSSVSCVGTSILTCTLNLTTPIVKGARAAFIIDTQAPTTTGSIVNYAATNPNGDGTPPGSPPNQSGCTVTATTVCSDTTSTPGTIGTPTTVVDTGTDLVATGGPTQTVYPGTQVTVVTTCNNAGPIDAAVPTCVVTGAPSDARTTCSPTGLTVLSAGNTITCTTVFTPTQTGTIVITTTAGSNTPDAIPANNVARTDVNVIAAPPALLPTPAQPTPALGDLAKVLLALLMVGAAVASRRRFNPGQ